MSGMADAVRLFDDESNPRSNLRVGRRLSALMGAARISPRRLADKMDMSISHETIRHAQMGLRGLSQEEAFYVDLAIGDVFRAEVGDVVDWLLSGYHGGPSRPLAGTRAMGP